MTAPFISWIGHGAASLAPAGVFQGATAHAFAFRSDRAAMQRLTDKLLNPAGGGKVKYRTFVDRAVLTFSDIERCTSSIDQIGWTPGRECALWVPLLEFRDGLLPTRMVLWSPYIYISYTIGMLTGREVWGWSKVFGKIDVPAGGASDGEFSCSTALFHPMAPSTPVNFAPLVKVVGTASQHAQAPALARQDVLRQARERLFDGAGDEALTLPFQPVAVALKQLRDVANPALACYQAICDAPLQVTRCDSMRLLPSSGYTLQVTTCDSHPIVKDFLGRAPDPGHTDLPVEWAVRAEVDFEAPAGSVVA